MMVVVEVCDCDLRVVELMEDVRNVMVVFEGVLCVWVVVVVFVEKVERALVIELEYYEASL